MNARSVCAWVLAVGMAWAATASATSTNDVRVGDTAQKVLAVLGEPNGFIKSGKDQLLIYDRGRVSLSNDVVVRVELVSAEEAEWRKADDQRQREERAAAVAARREQLLQEGTALKEKAVNDPQFLALRGADQVRFWKEFAGKYPDVAVELEYSKALARQRVEAEEEDIRQRLQAVEQRAADAEVRAQRAEAERAEAERRSQTTYGWYTPALGWGWGWQPWPTIQRHRDHDRDRGPVASPGSNAPSIFRKVQPSLPSSIPPPARHEKTYVPFPSFSSPSLTPFPEHAK
jgi:hypothetical protein